jgi:RNA polymerase sigma-70 factor (ECF subfamily)
MQAIQNVGCDTFCQTATVVTFHRPCRTSTVPDRAAETFESHRSRLFGVAYRILKSRADAEDVLQDAYLRWHETAKNDIESPVGFLITVTTRLCLDRLRHWKKECAEYVDSPEGIAEDYVPSPEQQCETAAEVSTAIVTVLERLGSEERATFLLREVFDYDYSEVAQMVGKSEPACRQLTHRARTRLRNSRARFVVTAECRERVLKRFFAATATYDRRAVMALLAEHVEYVPAAQ